MGDGPVTLFLCGDVMLGRGVDQILPGPGDPELRESYVRDARTYVELAEAANGPIRRPVEAAWPWGVALAVLEQRRPDARIVNLETSVTSSAAFVPGKSVHYRMSPANLPSLEAATPDVCALANNHVLDFGRRGLLETLDALSATGLRTAGAGRTESEAWHPAAVQTAGDGQVLVFSFGLPSSGIPRSWAATRDRPGVSLLPNLAPSSARRVIERVRSTKRVGDIAVVSIHWGPNWGYDVTSDEIRFAHSLIDGGVDVVHGHSSHHPRPIEVYRGRLVLYGCGDFVDDYEGIRGWEEFRDDLRVMYFASLDRGTGRLAGLTMVPLHARQMRLEYAAAADRSWLDDTLNRVSREFGTRVEPDAGGTLTLRLPDVNASRT